ncbi:hypothetical protein Acsp06_58480 [Actinomycetospora sp. NBRC 106375]|uniref:pyridoxamine 5'-phosphate oxidase family protein n=1 Tax=Actinomycetospora sp. NBRC 106375 TaxID=3032207 RepID=UPI0024A080A8|nr:pyridoxamine 5'-phosphate oxidase family protein [Actinomycetospora sp. NBRC 106375]GLZ49663.1 hypothetical protein Acsp06_58480 [Actinomycetospora sp. NBRC 106375]
MTVDHGIVEPLGAAESLALVLTAELGRLAFTDERGPTVEPFAVAVEDTAIVLAAGPHSGARATAGQTVAFEVDEIDPVHRSG